MLFEVKAPNATTVAAMNESRKLVRAKAQPFDGLINELKKSKSSSLSPLEFQAVNFRYYHLFAEKVYLPLYEKMGEVPSTSELARIAQEIKRSGKAAYCTISA